jgi:hypothetical protein
MNFDIELPENTNPETRIAWAGERFADLVVGNIQPEVGWFVWGVIVGWTDSSPPDETRQYLELSRCFEELLHNA